MRFGKPVPATAEDCTGQRSTRNPARYTNPQTTIQVNEQTGVAIASDGSNYLAVWSDSRNADLSGSDIYATMFSADGQPLTDKSILVSGARGDQVLPSVGYNRTDYLVVWQDGRNFDTASWDIYAARISGEDTV